MNATNSRILTGCLFIAGCLLINIPYTLLIINFDYPAILRQDAGYILSAFAAGGTGLVWTWLGFAWLGLPILLGMMLLPRILSPAPTPLLQVATILGLVAGFAQMLGLLRWVFVVPALAHGWIDPAGSPATKDALKVAFGVVNQFGGVLLGEHLGQTLTIAWMALTSIFIIRSKRLGPWLGWFGLAASAVYLMAQGELLATVLPGFPALPEAGLAGSLCWLAWMVALGVSLIARRTPA